MMMNLIQLFRLMALSISLFTILAPQALAFSRSGKTYTIKKGNHSSGIHFGTFKGKSLSLSFQFDDGAIYTTKDPANQLDTNKLAGFTDCNSLSPTENSARLGWRWLNQRIEIMAYVDYKGKHYFNVLGHTFPGEVSTGSIKLENNKYAFYYKGNKVLMDRHCSKSNMVGFELYPYFGGQETAPKDVKIWVREN